MNNFSFSAQFIAGENKVFFDSQDISSLNKEDAIKNMEIAFNYVALIIENTNPEEFSKKIIFKGIEVTQENIY